MIPVNQQFVMQLGQSIRLKKWFQTKFTFVSEFGHCIGLNQSVNFFWWQDFLKSNNMLIFGHIRVISVLTVTQTFLIIIDYDLTFPI